MRGQTLEKILITLGLAVLLTEFLKMSDKLWGGSTLMCVFSTISCVIIVFLLWVYLVIYREDKKYEQEKKAEDARNKMVDFEAIYKELYSENIDYLEKKRIIQRDRRVLKYGGLLVALGSIMLILYFFSSDYGGAGVDLIPLVLIGFGVFAAASAVEKEREMEYKAAYKLRIIPGLLKNINPKLTYKDTEIGEEQLMNEYDIANFGLSLPTKGRCLDKIEGAINNKYTEMLEIKLDAELENGTKRPTTIEVFNGFFVKIHGNKAWEYKLKLSSVGVESRAAIYESGTKKIKMDNKDITEEFVVQTNDNLTTNRILTSEMLELLVNYKRKYGIVFDVAVKNGDIYFLFYTGNLFEPDVLTNSMKKDLMLKEYSMLKLVIELMEKIDAVVSEVQQ